MNSSIVRKLDFSDVLLYGVTTSIPDSEFILMQSEKMLKGGVDAIQLRNKDLKDRALLDLGEKLKNLCHQYEALFLIDDRPDLALILDADGVHLGHEDMPLEKARELIGHRKILGASTHSLPQALKAQKAGADYVSCGPIWGTPTKPDTASVGLNLIGLYRAALKVPFVVIGGVNLKNIHEIVIAGGRRVAVVRALFDSPDPEKMALELKETLKGTVASQI